MTLLTAILATAYCFNSTVKAFILVATNARIRQLLYEWDIFITNISSAE